jgi:hypothetical protein
VNEFFGAIGLIFIVLMGMIIAVAISDSELIWEEDCRQSAEIVVDGLKYKCTPTNETKKILDLRKNLMVLEGKK